METLVNSLLQPWIERYRLHTERLNHSKRTWPTTRGILNRLDLFLAEQNITELAHITPEVLADYQSWLFERPTANGKVRSISGQNRCLRAVKGFCRFLYEEEQLLRNPAAKLRYAKEPQTLPRNVLTPEEARQIIEAADVHTVIGYRDRVILEVLYATGIRKSELQNLLLEDLSLQDGLLRINGGKGAKDRVVPLTQIAVTFLESYIKGVRQQLLGDKRSNHLFISMRGNRMAKNTVDHLIAKYADRAGIEKHVTCHLWRHTCATHLIRNQANLRHVQELLGHRRLTTTERYLHLTITDLKVAHSKFHPREKETGNP